jgi:hypothetical protein
MKIHSVVYELGHEKRERGGGGRQREREGERETERETERQSYGVATFQFNFTVPCVVKLVPSL